MEDEKYLTDQEIMIALLSGKGLGNKSSYVRLDDMAGFLRVWEDGTEESFPSELIFGGMWSSVYDIDTKDRDPSLEKYLCIPRSEIEMELHDGGAVTALGKIIVLKHRDEIQC